MVATFRVGTCSWTDPTLLASGFYPPGCASAEARLRFYASLFNTVEVDATYYALPNPRTAAAWVDRTPPDFDFNVKAFAWLTHHDAEVRALPPALRDELPPDQRTQRRTVAPSPALRALAFDFFLSALEPLRAANKLGCLLFQFPPWFRATDANRAYLAECRARCPRDRLAVEFRHPSWYGAQEVTTFDFLARHGLLGVSLDTPSAAGIPPTTFHAAGEVAYVRFHGRNRSAWFRRTHSAAERFKYFYADAELEAWATRLRAAQSTRTAYVLFNNCFADYGTRNALTMRNLLGPAAQ